MSLNRRTLLKYAVTGLVSLALLLLHNTTVTAKKAPWLKGPIPAHVERIIDGDTVVVRARIWLDQELKIRVRLSGINAPEMHSRNPDERKSAASARNTLHRLVHGRTITLHNIRRGKYAGRVIAELHLRDGTDISKHLLNAGAVRPYPIKRNLHKPCDWEGCTRTTTDTINIAIAP